MGQGVKHRLRIVHATLGLATGGQEKLLVEFARHADRARFELEFVVLGDRGPLAQVIEEHGWRITTLGEPTGLRPGLVLRVKRVLNACGADVVHTHDDRPLLYGAPAARMARLRCVHTHHHGWLPQTTPRGARLVSWAARLVDPFVCVSHESARQIIGQGVPAERVQVIWNGIDLDRFAFHGPRLDGPAVTVTRLSAEKDLATLLHAIPLVTRAEPSFRLEIAGDGPCREELLTLTGELGISGHVNFLGEVGDVPGLLQRARMFVLPSQSEGLSLTLLEAMASGLPVVTTRVGGNPEVVAEDVTGLLVPPGQPAALAAGIMRLWREPSLLQQYGEAARRRAERYFDVRAMVARYEALYEARRGCQARPQPASVEASARRVPAKEATCGR
jgi:glycosyltransferase involved in cell wall biosynthesis